MYLLEIFSSSARPPLHLLRIISDLYRERKCWRCFAVGSRADERKKRQLRNEERKARAGKATCSMSAAWSLDQAEFKPAGAAEWTSRTSRLYSRVSMAETWLGPVALMYIYKYKREIKKRMLFMVPNYLLRSWWECAYLERFSSFSLPFWFYPPWERARSLSLMP